MTTGEPPRSDPDTAPPGSSIAPPLHATAVLSHTPGEHRALAGFAAVAALAIAWIGQPVAIGLLLGTLTAFTLQPLYLRLRIRTPPRPDIAAILCVSLAGVVFAGLAGILGYLLVQRGVLAAGALPTAIAPDGVVRVLVDRLVALLESVHIRAPDINARLADAVASVASSMTTVAGALASATLDGLLTFFFILLTLHFMLRHWDQTTRRIESLLPLHPRHTHALLEEFRRVGRTVLLGTVLTGLAQGFFAGIGYVVTGVPEPALLGASTAVASLVPVVGTLIIWVPAGLYLILTGHVGAGIAELIYSSVIVVGLSDYYIRPRLVGREADMPSLATFVALFGGIEVFGFVGLIVGPVIMSLALSVLRIYEREAAAGRK